MHAMLLNYYSTNYTNFYDAIKITYLMNTKVKTIYLKVTRR